MNLLAIYAVTITLIFLAALVCWAKNDKLRRWEVEQLERENREIEEHYMVASRQLAEYLRASAMAGRNGESV